MHLKPRDRHLAGHVSSTNQNSAPTRQVLTHWRVAAPSFRRTAPACAPFVPRGVEAVQTGLSAWSREGRRLKARRRRRQHSNHRHPQNRVDTTLRVGLQLVDRLLLGGSHVVLLLNGNGARAELPSYGQVLSCSVAERDDLVAVRARLADSLVVATPVATRLSRPDESGDSVESPGFGDLVVQGRRARPSTRRVRPPTGASGRRPESPKVCRGVRPH